MDTSDKPTKPSSPGHDRYYPEQPGGYPPIPPPSSGPPSAVPGGSRSDNGRINGNGIASDEILPGSSLYRPYSSETALPLRQKPGQLPDPPPSQSYPPQPQQPQPQPPYPPQYPQRPPSLVEIAPQPTMSTAGSVVGGGPGGMGGGPPGGPPVGPGGYGNYPQRPDAPALTQSPGPMYANETATKSDLRAARSSVEEGLRRLIDLQRQHRQHLQYGPGAANVPNSTAAAVQEQLRLQTGSVMRDLRYVRRTLSSLAKAAESHRFRRWLVGGILAVFVPLVRRLFRRPSKRSGNGANAPGKYDSYGRIMASNDTEYAFARSRSIVDRMLGSVRRHGGLASIAFFVFAVLYIFSNEVSLRVARTVGRRLKKLSSKIERADEELNEADLKLLAGWRWRVLLWGRK